MEFPCETISTGWLVLGSLLNLPNLHRLTVLTQITNSISAIFVQPGYFRVPNGYRWVTRRVFFSWTYWAPCRRPELDIDPLLTATSHFHKLPSLCPWCTPWSTVCWVGTMVTYGDQFWYIIPVDRMSKGKKCLLTITRHSKPPMRDDAGIRYMFGITRIFELWVLV